jgi:flagellar assembly factor FliW
MQFELKLPILGFESATSMELTKIDDVFMRLESSNKDFSFTLINPFVLREYTFDIPSSLQALLAINSESNLLIYNLIILTTPIENSSINFVAPFVFNTDNQTMAQVIIDNRSDFAITEPISNYLKESTNE